MNAFERTLVAVELSVLAWLAFTEDLGTVGMAALMVIGAVVLGLAVWTRWPYGALTALVAASAMPRLTGTLFGLHVRPEHVVIAYIFLALLLDRTKRGQGDLRWRAFDYALMVFVALNFLSSTVASPQPGLTLRWAAMSAIVVGAYFLVRVLIQDDRSLNYAFKVILLTGALESAFGIFCFLSNRAFETKFGVAVEQYGYMPGTHGTQYEANLFGAYSACCAVMFLVVYLLGQESRRSWHAWGLALTSAGTLISLSRAAIMALIVVALFVLWTAFHRRQLRIGRTFAFALVGGILLVAISPLIFSFLEERFSSIDLSELSSDQDTQVRLVQIVAAYDDVVEHPYWGSGTDSFRLMFDWREHVPNGIGGEDDAGYIGNTPLRVLHDTGAVGLAIFVTFLGALWLATRKCLKNTLGSNRVLGFALSASLLVYCVTFLSTEATLLAFPWVHLGMLAAWVSVFDARERTTNLDPSLASFA